jgi:tetratricopeptide (TPR) repeat protein
MKSICRRLTTSFILLAMAAFSVAASPQTNSLMTDGNHAYMRGDFAGAIKAYQQALDGEKKQPTLDRSATIALIDNLGTVYGITGNWDKAREAFDYGVSKYPTYPIFYYDIACVYGRKKDMENAITYLQKASANKAGLASGEKMPDALNDNSFAAFKDNEKFVRAAKSLSDTAQ